MDLTNTFVTLTQQADAEKPSLFPFPFSMHLVFILISIAFFSYRFIMQKRPYQIIMAAAILASMGVWLSDNRKVYYGVGLIDVILILAALVTAIVFKAPEEEESDSDDSSNTKSTDNVVLDDEAAPVWGAAQTKSENDAPAEDEAPVSDNAPAETSELTVDQILESLTQED